VQKESKDVPIYQLKVTLDGIKPPIWRRIQVSGDISLFKLHKIIQAAMGWEDYHLHQFMVGEDHYTIPSPEDPWPMETKNEKQAKLFLVVPIKKTRFIYEYDFGDSWYHIILVEKILHPEERQKHPVCLAGKRSGPPEDCGGIGGYYEFLEAIGNPKHPSHEDMLEWAGGDFDSERFDMEEINRLLSKIK
jgi:Plasmid pRiA4b ORF-3-like protein